MKKLLCLVLALLLLGGCANSPDPASPTEDPQSTTAPAATDPPVTDPPATEPSATEPSATEPESTDPPQEDPPVEAPPEEEPFLAHEKFDAAVCAPVVGTWTTIIVLEGSLQNLELFTGCTSFRLYYSFDEEGYFRAWADQEEFDKAIDDFEAMVIDHMVELRYITFKGPLEYQGVPEDEIRERWLEGPEVETRVECEESVAALNLYHRFKRLLREGQYYISDGKLYTQLSADSFESNGYQVSDGAISLRNTNNMSMYRDICVYFPLLFVKVP